MPTKQAILIFFKHICYVTAPCPTLDGYYLGVSLAYLMLITAFLQSRPKGHQEPHNKVGFLGLARHLNNA